MQLLLVPANGLPLTLRKVLVGEQAEQVKNRAKGECDCSLSSSQNEISATAADVASAAPGTAVDVVAPSRQRCLARSAAHSFCEMSAFPVDGPE